MAGRGMEMKRRIEAMRNREAWTRGNLTAVKGDVYSLGRLPEEHVTQYNADRAAIVYTILSYNTPICWILSDGTVRMPDCKFSVTTTSQQGEVRRMLGGW